MLFTNNKILLSNWFFLMIDRLLILKRTSYKKYIKIAIFFFYKYISFLFFLYKYYISFQLPHKCNFYKIQVDGNVKQFHKSSDNDILL